MRAFGEWNRQVAVEGVLDAEIPSPDVPRKRSGRRNRHESLTVSQSAQRQQLRGCPRLARSLGTDCSPRFRRGGSEELGAARLGWPNDGFDQRTVKRERPSSQPRRTECRGGCDGGWRLIDDYDPSVASHKYQLYWKVIRTIGRLLPDKITKTTMLVALKCPSSQT